MECAEHGTESDSQNKIRNLKVKIKDKMKIIVSRAMKWIKSLELIQLYKKLYWLNINMILMEVVEKKVLIKKKKRKKN